MCQSSVFASLWYSQCVQTIRGTLRCWPLAAAPSDANAVDNKALFGLISKAASFVGTRWTGSTVDDI